MSTNTSETSTKNGANGTKNPKTDFEDISTEVYPDRTGNYKSGNWGENYIKVRCQTKIAKAIESSKFEFVLIKSLLICYFDIKKQVLL